MNPIALTVADSNQNDLLIRIYSAHRDLCVVRMTDAVNSCNIMPSIRAALLEGS